MDLLQREHHKFFFAGMGWGMEKVAFGTQKLQFSLKQGKIGARLLYKVQYMLAISAKINDLV